MTTTDRPPNVCRHTDYSMCTDQQDLLNDMRRFMRSHVQNGEQRTADVLARAIGAIESLRKGEFICKQCGLRKDGEKPNVDF